MGFLKDLLNKILKDNRLKYDVEFTIDYLNINYDEKLENVKVVFPSDSRDILINGMPMYFKSGYIKEAGWSNDKLYRKIYTGNFAFWIKPKDYDNILNIMKDREVNYQRDKQEERVMIKNIYTEEFEYDGIDSDIYKCCIVGKSDSSLISGRCGGKMKDFEEIENHISEICKDHGGRYYKTQAKSVKFVIIFSCGSRTASSVKSYRDKGYKVTSFENALKYFNLTNLWDINKMEDEILRVREEVMSL